MPSVACGLGPKNKGHKDGCKKELPLVMTYRCYDCGSWFCRECMGAHLGRAAKAETKPGTARKAGESIADYVERIGKESKNRPAPVKKPEAPKKDEKPIEEKILEYLQADVFFKTSNPPITIDFVKDLLDLFPVSFLRHQFKRMRLWLRANPEKRKKRYMPFIMSWLSSEIEKQG